MSKESLLKGMNDKQQEAVLQTEGPLLIMAGAGSGKTRVLTHRIAYLIEEKGIMPWRILAITFTNKAAKEMRTRIVQLLGESGNDVWASTFHALCVRILRRHIDLLGYNRAFTIADTSEQRTLVKRIMKDLNLDPNSLILEPCWVLFQMPKIHYKRRVIFENQRVVSFEERRPKFTRLIKATRAKSGS